MYTIYDVCTPYTMYVYIHACTIIHVCISELCVCVCVQVHGWAKFLGIILAAGIYACVCARACVCVCVCV